MDNPSVFISIAGVDAGWIVGKIAEDIQSNLKDMNIECRYGTPNEYQGEDICHHMGYLYAEPKKEAKINSVFITHIDDAIKENTILREKDRFDYFITMSSYDKNYLDQLGFDSSKTYGLALPARNQYVKPISLGIFSAYYKDGRKNEQWVRNFCANNPNHKLLNFVFVGPHWGDFLPELTKLDANFEWHNVSREMPYEYIFQQNKLEKLDYFFYLGIDGGAMGTYDGYAMGNKLIVTKNCYHLDIPNVDYYIDSEQDFDMALKEISEKQKNKIDFFADNNPKEYTKKLLKIWENKFDYEFPIYDNVVANKRNYHSRLTVQRVLAKFKRSISKKLG